MLRKKVRAGFMLAAFVVSVPARAGDAALAESLFRAAKSEMDSGNYVAACPKLSESYAQDPATGTLFALAYCQEHLGQTASAWATYAEVASRAKQDGRKDREDAARDAMANLEQKLSRLTIQVDTSTAQLPGLVVERDGKPVGPAAWGVAAAVDPGAHLLRASAPGKKPWSSTVSIGASAETQTVQIPVLVDDAAPPAAAVPAPAPSATASLPAPSGAPSGPESPSAEPSESSGPPLRTIGLVTGGVGILTLGVSGFFGLRASSLNSDSKKDGHCDANDECDPTGLSKRNDAVGASTTATITLIAGSVLTAAGVTLFVVGGSSSESPRSARVDAHPLVGQHEAGFTVRGRF